MFTSSYNPTPHRPTKNDPAPSTLTPRTTLIFMNLDPGSNIHIDVY